jgi:hypothetical protein
MKTSKNFQTTIAVLIFALLFAASASVQPVSQTVTTFNENSTRRTSDSINIKYTIPKFKLLQNASQTQTKGGVTITCNILPFKLDQTMITESVPFYRDPNKPDYDVMLIKNKPSNKVSPDKVIFSITIKNNQERILKLRECAMVVLIDNIQYSIPEEVLKHNWENTMVLSKFSSTVKMEGPSIEELKNPKSIEIFLNDIPTAFDNSGNITKRENFDWIFECKSEEQIQKSTITYSYEETPVKTKRCDACSGKGSFKESVTCIFCNGEGRRKNKEGNIIACGYCENNSGKNYKNKTCATCAGQGLLKYPQSPLPPIASQVMWNGWKVMVNSIPTGATVKLVNIKTGLYENVGQTPIEVNWLSSQNKQYPIIVEYNNKETKILPFDVKGKQLKKVQLNIAGSEPEVIEGTKGN